MLFTKGYFSLRYKQAATYKSSIGIYIGLGYFTRFFLQKDGETTEMNKNDVPLDLATSEPMIPVTTVVVAPPVPHQDHARSILRKIWAVVPIGFALYNTITQVQNQAQAIGTFTSPIPDGTPAVGVYVATSSKPHWQAKVDIDSSGNPDYLTASYFYASSFDASSEQSCIYGSPTVNILCPYKTNTTYIGFITVWIIYFVSLMAFNFFFSIRYHATDLRYFISCVKCMTHPANIALVYAGHALTLASVIAVIAVTYKQCVDNELYPDETDTVMRPIVQSSLIFAVLNVQCISSFTAPRLFAFLANINMDDFKEEIDISGIPGKANSDVFNLYGALVNVADVLNYASDAYAREHLLDEDHSEHLGTNTEAIRRAFKAIYESKARSEGDAAVFSTSNKA